MKKKQLRETHKCINLRCETNPTKHVHITMYMPVVNLDTRCINPYSATSFVRFNFIVIMLEFGFY